MGGLSGYVSREFHYVMTDLINDYDWRQMDTVQLLSGPGRIKDKLLSRFGEVPEVILFWKGYEFLPAQFSAISALDCHKMIFADDLHSWDEQMRLRKLVSFGLCKTILCSCAYLWPRFYPELVGAKRVVWIPHSASPDFFVAYNQSPENSVFLSGAVNDLYPLRQKVKEMHSRRAHSIVYHPHLGYHCGYDHARDENVGRGYAEKINRCRAAFTDSLVYGYVVAKYFEIPSTGALLLADDTVSEPLRRLGFIENEHYLPVSMDSLEDRIQYVLDEANHEELDHVRRAGQDLVRGKHTTRDRARSINEACCVF